MGDSGVRSEEAPAILVDDSASVCIAAIDSDFLPSPAVHCRNGRGVVSRIISDPLVAPDAITYLT